MDDGKQVEQTATSNLRPLAQAIAGRASEITRRVVAKLYENPFWEDRFGARGRRFSEEDGQYHLSYLGQALAAGDRGDVAILVNYARWLRGVLVSRGMSSRHLAENFTLLAAVLGKEPLPGIDGVEPGVEFLERAARSLRYEDGPASVLQAHEEAILASAIATICAQHAGWISPVPQQTTLRDFLDDELRTYLSYLADAVASGKLEIFTKYINWHSDFLMRRRKIAAAADVAKMPRAAGLLEPLERAVSAVDSQALQSVIAPIFAAARSAAG